MKRYGEEVHGIVDSVLRPEESLWKICERGRCKPGVKE